MTFFPHYRIVVNANVINRFTHVYGVQKLFPIYYIISDPAKTQIYGEQILHEPNQKLNNKMTR